MNERIKELAVQAGYSPDMFGIGHWDMPECKKYTELIIMECLTICEELGDKGMDGHYCADEIQKRFGLGHMANVLAGAKVVTDDGGYSIGTKEGYESFARNRMK